MGSSGTHNESNLASVMRGKQRGDPVRREDPAFFNEKSKPSVLDKGAQDPRTQGRMASVNASARKPVKAPLR